MKLDEYLKMIDPSRRLSVSLYVYSDFEKDDEIRYENHTEFQSLHGTLGMQIRVVGGRIFVTLRKKVPNAGWVYLSSMFFTKQTASYLLSELPEAINCLDEKKG